MVKPCGKWMNMGDWCMCYIDLLISDQWKLLRFDLFEGFSRESECFFQGHVARLCEVLTGKDANVQAVKSESSARRNISTDSPNIYASRFKYIFFIQRKNRRVSSVYPSSSNPGDIQKQPWGFSSNRRKTVGVGQSQEPLSHHDIQGTETVWIFKRRWKSEAPKVWVLKFSVSDWRTVNSQKTMVYHGKTWVS